MKKILIVDDDQVTRKLFGNVFARLGSFELYEAENGQEAVDICRDNEIDLVLMDIFMPVMDGIDATKEIKSFDKHVTIVAVSIASDSNTTEKMLQAGAEDYLTKPIKADFLLGKLKTYLRIMRGKDIYDFGGRRINLYNETVKSKVVVFRVGMESALIEFWDHYLNDYPNQSEALCDTVHAIYGLGFMLLRMKTIFFIFVVESDDFIYFTISDSSRLNPKVLAQIIDRSFHSSAYHVEDEKITFAVNKKGVEAPLRKVVPEAPASKKADKPKETKKTAKAEEIVSTKAHGGKEEVLRVYDFIEEHDLEELKECVKELDSVLILFSHAEFKKKDAKKISDIISKMSAILASYNETFDISVALRSLSFDITENIDYFIENAKDISIYISDFSADLTEWFEKLFVDGAPSIDFLDASIIATAGTIASIIKPSSASAEGIGDLFMFDASNLNDLINQISEEEKSKK